MKIRGLLPLRPGGFRKIPYE